MSYEEKRLLCLVIRVCITLVVLNWMGNTPRIEASDVSDVLAPERKVKGKLERRRERIKRMREAAKKDWRYGGYLDVGYLPNLSSPDADRW